MVVAAAAAAAGAAVVVVVVVVHSHLGTLSPHQADQTAYASLRPLLWTQHKAEQMSCAC